MQARLKRRAEQADLPGPAAETQNHAPEEARYVRPLASVRLAASAETEPRLRTVVGRQLADLQRSYGNQFLLRLLRAAHGIGNSAGASSSSSIQRYAVGVAPDADYDTALSWLNSSNPYSGDQAWAKTIANFSWSSRGIQVLPTDEEGTYSVRVLNPRVTVNKQVDMPEWTPTDEPLLAAWNAMLGQLRAHEAQHERVADEWQTTLRDRLAAASYTVTATDEQDALDQGTALVNNDWAAWLDDHQAAQESLDPYSAPFVRPPGEEAPAPEEAPDG